ncbi:MAG: hypothetical protein O7C75_15690 [Verrucomicrobia bacterium]|nr:hypothetical protein [Verrucomicrobiota bacterium]
MKLSPKTLAIVVITVLFATCLNAANNKIAVRAEATIEYTKGRALDETKKIQTYQFMKGRYFPGDLKRVSMEKVTFREILENMAVHLQKQNFYPDPEYGEGDLVLVVHYGVTHREFSYDDMLGYTSLSDYGFNAVGAATSDLTRMDATASLGANVAMRDSFNHGNASSAQFKAMLLGMEEAFDWNPPENEYDLKSMIYQPRYFVVLMAFDLPLAKQGILQVHWTTRYSIRATGQSFDQAILAMNDVAGDFFGKNLEGLNKKFLDDDSRVVIGDIEVIGEEKEE